MIVRVLGQRGVHGFRVMQDTKRNMASHGGGGLSPGLVFGKRQMQQARNWLPTATCFGAAAFVGMCYFTEWRVTNEWIPFYNGKFKTK